MRFTATFLSLLCLVTSEAFSPAFPALRRHTVLRAEEAEESAAIDKPPFDQGTHDELVYALGVNLARQLGDVRPLVESGEELACVAKGLLDTVIGRLSEEGQRDLLQRRGKELNVLITDRA